MPLNQNPRNMVGVSRANISFPSTQNCRIVSFRQIVYRPFASIPLPRLRSGIRISRGDVIARRLLQRVGLRLRALRIQLLAELAFGAAL